MLYKPDRAFREPEISKQLGEKFSMNEKAITVHILQTGKLV